MTIPFDLATFRQQSRLLALLSEAGQEELLRSARALRFSPGSVLMREGETGDEFYVITEGSVRVAIDDLGSPREVARLGRGAFLGEIAALLKEPRSATVIAHDEVAVLCFAAETVSRVLEDSPRVREALVKLALKRSEENFQKLLGADFGLPDASEP